MSSIITSILSSTVGLLWNKARDTTAGNLKGGDVTDAKIRKIVVRELDDIKSKLDGLSLKDLHSSYCFLQEGVDLLNNSLSKSKPEQKAVLNETRSETSRMSSGGDKSSILNEALQLSDAMRRVKLHSDKELESAKKRFEDARRRATDAFCNEALSIQDRIFAAKLRIISEILEYLESPETAITGCMSFLKKLHGLPAIRETFSVYLTGGVKSLVNKAERVENVKSVMLINQFLFHYFQKFGSGNYSYLDWPTIELVDRSFQPILHWQEISTRKSMGNELMLPPKGLILDEYVDPICSAVNGQGSIVTADWNNEEIMVIATTGETEVVIFAKFPESRDRDAILQYISGLAVDINDDNNIYVVGHTKRPTESRDVAGYVLNVLDANYTIKHLCTLDFLEDSHSDESDDKVTIAINKNNDIIMTRRHDSHVYVCDNNGNMKHKFKLHSCYADHLSITEKNEIMLAESYGKDVKIFTEDGNLRSTINLPADHLVLGAAFHYVLCKIIVLTCISNTKSHFLLSFSESGELETSMFFCNTKEYEPQPMITSHPNNPVAVVRDRSVAFM